MVGRPGSGQDRVALVVGRGGGPDRGGPPGHRRAAGPGPPGPGRLPRRPPGRAGPAVRGHPPAPPHRRAPRSTEAIADERRLLEAIRDRADVVVDTGRAQRQPAPRPRHSSSSATSRTRPCARRWCPSATSTACPSTPTSSSTAASCPTRTGSSPCAPLSGLDEPVRDFVLGQDGDRRLPGPGGRPRRHAPPRLRRRGEVVPDHRHGLHRRPPPLGGPGRGAGPAAARPGAPRPSVFHRDVDR